MKYLKHLSILLVFLYSITGALNAQTWYAIANDHYWMGIYQSAADNYSKCISLNRESKNTMYSGDTLRLCYYLRGRCFFETQKYTEATTDFAEAINLKPTPEAYYWRALAYTELNELDKAMPDFTAVIEFRPSYIDVNLCYLGRGHLYTIKKDYQKALEDYKNAVTLSATADNYKWRGIGYYNLEKYDEALNDFNASKAVRPDWVTDCWIARAYDKQKNYPNAIEAFSLAIKANPKDAEQMSAYSGRGKIYFGLKKYEEAVADYGQAIAYNPSANFWYSRGMALFGLNQLDSAIINFSQAIILNPKLGVAYQSRGFIYCQQNKTALAQADEKKAIEYGKQISNPCVAKSTTTQNQTTPTTTSKPIVKTEPTPPIKEHPILRKPYNEANKKAADQKGEAAAAKLNAQIAGKTDQQIIDLFGTAINTEMNKDVYAGFVITLKMKPKPALIQPILQLLDYRNRVAIKTLSKYVTGNYINKQENKAPIPYPVDVPAPGYSWDNSGFGTDLGFPPAK